MLGASSSLGDMATLPFDHREKGKNCYLSSQIRFLAKNSDFMPGMVWMGADYSLNGSHHGLR